MLLGILLVIEILVCAALVGVILLQRSEGGALGMGGGPSGFLTARGAGDLLTRTTSILAGVFFVLALVLTLLSGRSHSGGSVTDRTDIRALNPNTLNESLKIAPQPQSGAPQPQSPTAPGSTGDNGAGKPPASLGGLQTAPQSQNTISAPRPQ